MARLNTPVRKQEDRLQGRLVEIDAQMYLVTHVDTDSGFATLVYGRQNNNEGPSDGTPSARRTLQMPIPEVFFWLAKKTREQEPTHTQR